MATDGEQPGGSGGSGLHRPGRPLIRFLGGAESVTGSKFLIDTPRARVMVDCGLFQGLKELRLRNWEAFPVEPASLDAVILTHAHLDHCGYLPALWRRGFRGRVLATEGTRRLCEVILTDSGRIQEDDAEYASRHGFSKHEPALPLYTEEDAQRILERFEVAAWSESLEVAEGVSTSFRMAGHILGSSIVTLRLAGETPHRVAFSGDLGRQRHPLLLPPEPPPEVDTLVVESTYGDRRHGDEEVVERFAKALVETLGRGGVVVVPAFAVDRTELVLLLLRRLVEAGRVPEAPVYVDSPMALAALSIYRDAIRDGWPELRPELHGAEAPFTSGSLHEVHSVDESRELTELAGPAVIVSASGMATGGRVLHHLASRLPDARNSVLLVGYQAFGTRGRRLLDGARVLKLLGRYVPVHADVVDLSALSVHADRDELLGWLGRAPRPPGVTFVVHGERRSSDALRQAIEDELDWTAVVPSAQERVRLV